MIGIDPGTISIDLCGLADGRVFLDRSLPTAEALAHPSIILQALEEAGPLDLVVGPSGYGLPVTAARDLTEDDVRLAYLAAPGETGGIGGLRGLMRALAASALPVVLTPGVIHLASVPAHRKINRVDMGTADKVCAVVLAVREHTERRRCTAHEASFVMVELGGAFTAVIAVLNGQIVDGISGSAGPLGLQAAGALDGEVAFLAGAVSKRMVFEGGVSTIAGEPGLRPAALIGSSAPSARLALEAYLEGVIKAIAAISVSLTDQGDRSDPAFELLLSGRLAAEAWVHEALAQRLARLRWRGEVHRLRGFATTAKHAAQGAALMADGLAGGAAAPVVDALGVREARGTLLDHLHVISPASARARLGIGP